LPALGSCRVCRREDVDQIDRRLAGGARARTLGREIGVPEATLRTHRHRCMQLARFTETRAFSAALAIVRRALVDFPDAQAAVDGALVQAGVREKEALKSSKGFGVSLRNE
jgi:hypothetical protein